MINIAELLKDATTGMKLYSPLFGEVKFVGIDKQSVYPINVTDCKGNGKSFTEFGVYFADHPDAECLLFPSKDCRTWEYFKLPTKPKFKVEDWIANDYCVGKVIALTDDAYLLDRGQGIPFSCEHNAHLWTIQDAKDGDVLVDTLSGTRAVTILFRGINADDSINAYCGWNEYTFRVTTNGAGYGTLSSTRYVPATKEQRDQFFAKIKEAGYQWDGEKKELKKIQPHYDIANFKAGMPVLARGAVEERWTYVLFSHSYVGSDGKTHFNAGGWIWNQCIPFEGNKKLLGTTDMPSEEYVNW